MPSRVAAPDSTPKMPRTAQFIRYMMQQAEMFHADDREDSAAEDIASSSASVLARELQQSPIAQPIFQQAPYRAIKYEEYVKQSYQDYEIELDVEDSIYALKSSVNYYNAKPAVSTVYVAYKSRMPAITAPVSRAGALAFEAEILSYRGRVDAKPAAVDVIELSSGGEDAQEPTVEVSNYLDGLFGQSVQTNIANQNLAQYVTSSVPDLNENELMNLRGRLAVPRASPALNPRAAHPVVSADAPDTSERIYRHYQALVERRLFYELESSTYNSKYNYFTNAAYTRAPIDKLNAIVALQYAPLRPTREDIYQAIRALYKLSVRLFTDCESDPFCELQITVDESARDAGKFILRGKLGKKQIKLECLQIKGTDVSTRFSRCVQCAPHGGVPLVLCGREPQEWILLIDQLQAERVCQSLVCLLKSVYATSDLVY